MLNYMCTYSSDLGLLTLTADEMGLTGLYLRPPGQKELLLPQDGPCFPCVKAWLDAYFCGQRPDPAGLPLHLEGTPFRLLVWQLLLDIPYGEVRTYAQVAQSCAGILKMKKMSAQAVGGAVGHNPISIIVPCHRVVASGNKLGGFGWGPEAKRWLLRHEGGNYDD